MKSLAKAAIVLFLVSTYKTLPFAYMVRFYSLVFRHLVFRERQYLKTRKNTYGFGEQPDDVFRPVAYRTYASPLEIDMYLHKSNLTYLVDLDMARTHFVCQIFQTLFMKYWHNETGEFRGKSLQNSPYVPVGTIQCTFKKEIKMFQRYSITSSVYAWDEKWLYVFLKFELTNGTLCAVAITKYVFKKKGRLTMRPRDFIAECGMYNDAVEKTNAENYATISQIKTSDELEKWADHLCAWNARTKSH